MLALYNIFVIENSVIGAAVHCFCRRCFDVSSAEEIMAVSLAPKGVMAKLSGGDIGGYQKFWGVLRSL